MQTLLNAFRHHGGRHRPEDVPPTLIPHCSTPFGITEVGTRAHRATPPLEHAAQRLSASRRSAPRRSPPSATPRSSAQRLSASRRSAPKRLAVGGKTYDCSTPFGITEVGTLGVERPLRRRERCSTPFGITEVGTGQSFRDGKPVELLNAFRHHGGRHWNTGAPYYPDFYCSTPFGITEVGTRRRSALDRIGPHLLNAFRHHGGRHRPAHGASRAGPRLLNAFRHHGGRHTRTLDGSSAPTRSAQRLSASRRSAHCPGELVETLRYCSTPFGITEVGTRARRRPPCGPARLLNAFRHHGGRH